MICPSCHTDNIEGADLCANCGQALSGLDLPGGAAAKKSPDFIHGPLAGLEHRAPVTVGVSDPVSLVVRLMQSQNAGAVLVLEGQRLAGIITGWDILYKVASPTVDLNAVTCAQVMSPDPLCLHDEDTLALALNLMAGGGFRHVPVLQGDRPVAVIDVGAVFRHISPHLV